jgi:hypothetical protein
MMKRIFAVLAFGLAMTAGAVDARAAAYDDRSSDDMISMLTGLGAPAEWTSDKDSGTGYVSAEKEGVKFYVDFTPCPVAAGTGCKGVVYNAFWTTTDVTATQMNGWNQRTFTCPGYLDTKGRPWVWLQMTAFGHQPRQDVEGISRHYLVCLRDFSKFVNDPDGFLKANPAD